ncbi:hypothetical protein QYF61_021612 [Mycteria americana]|uniref:Uncharacterized protein n=1 Tax=Mycteria americana TaxID=33587 RepID=A0AAN7NUR1_MYCAM|nr:hypothetical protein QYF61_021612 [Mycteria americana]
MSSELLPQRSRRVRSGRTAGAEGSGRAGRARSPRRGTARPGAARLPHNFAPAPRQVTVTRPAPAEAARPPPPRARLPAPLLHCQNSSGRPFTPALHGGHRSRRRAARSARRGTPSLALRQGEGDDPSRAEPPARPRQVPGAASAQRPTPTPDLRPAAREVERGGGAPHAGQPPSPSLPARAGQGQRLQPRDARGSRSSIGGSGKHLPGELPNLHKAKHIHPCSRLALPVTLTHSSSSGGSRSMSGEGCVQRQQQPSQRQEPAEAQAATRLRQGAGRAASRRSSVHLRAALPLRSPPPRSLPALPPPWGNSRHGEGAGAARQEGCPQPGPPPRRAPGG